jgi:hypothetical protein
MRGDRECVAHRDEQKSLSTVIGHSSIAAFRGFPGRQHFANRAEEAPVKTVLRRLQHLEQRQVEHSALAEPSGAKERLLARIAQMGDRLRSDPNWGEPTESDVEAIKQRVNAFFATRAKGV